MTNYVPAEQLLVPFGGKVEFEYNHGTYWPALHKLCNRRRKDYVARWVKGGKQIGESEVFLRGGESKCVSGEFAGLEFKEGFAE